MFQADGTAGGSLGDRLLDEESREWLRCLADDGRDGRSRIERESCLARLHGMLVRAARAELLRRSGRAPVQGYEREDLAHQAADDAMLAIVRKLGQFRGASRFTTWAYKFVMLEVSAQLMATSSGPLAVVLSGWLPSAMAARPLRSPGTRPRWACRRRSGPPPDRR